MVAAENGALPGGKVGGVGDVIRDLPVALAERGWRPTVVTPGYGFLADSPSAVLENTLKVRFRGTPEPVEVYRVPGPDPRVTHRVLEHPLFAPQGAGRVYCVDPPERPYATDASKFALFAASVIEYLATEPDLPEVLHLHDWHAALVSALMAYGPRSKRLRSLHTVLTIHNLAYQGVRPFFGDPSAMEAWFPDLCFRPSTLADPRYPHCVNFMAAAIRHVDRINTVSPTYAHEIQHATDPGAVGAGGEGLEHLLRAAAHEERLHGILNGCEYPDRMPRPRWPTVARQAAHAARRWAESNPDFASLLERMADRLDARRQKRPSSLLTSVGRITPQKVSLLLQPIDGTQTALQRILDTLAPDECFILLGSGDPVLEQNLATHAIRNEHFIFLRGYSEPLSESLYAVGDLFLMPSSFEPCGISQLLALRSGQPCVVHAVGGLRDTVEEGRTGFLFNGPGPHHQAEHLVDTVQRALAIKRESPGRWRSMRRRAAAARFGWGESAARYENELYAH